MTAVIRPTIAQVNLVDGANTAAVDASGHVSVVADALPLPSGAATTALQGAGLPGALGTNGGVKVDQAGSAWAVSAPGLSGGILQSVTTLTNAATAYHVPATPLALRAAMLVQAPATNGASVFLGCLLYTSPSPRDRT